jgi:serine phosphatase RsbU (regulator of sigma subunit)/Tfp pilus assembly protein PilF
LEEQIKAHPSNENFEAFGDHVYSLLMVDVDSSDKLGKIYYNLAVKYGNDENVARAEFMQAGILHQKSDYVQAEKLYKKCEEYAIDKKNYEFLVDIYNGLGLIENERGNPSKASEIFYKALGLIEKYNIDPVKKASLLINLGISASIIGDFGKAKEFSRKALNETLIAGDTVEFAHAYSNLASMMGNGGDFDSSIYYFERALLYVGDQYFLKGVILGNIGLCYYFNGKYDNADKYLKEGIKLRKEFGSIKLYLEGLTQVGLFYNSQKEFQVAETYCLEALGYATTKKYSGFNEIIFGCLKESAAGQGNFKNAYEYYNKEILARDSLINLDHRFALADAEAKAEYLVKSAEDSLLNSQKQVLHEAEIARQDAEIKAGRLQLYFLIAGVIIMFSGGLLIYSRFRVTKKQKRVIESQKNEVLLQKDQLQVAHNNLAEKNTEILDSIKYARRLQEAILPPTKLVKSYLPESFILYKPKDIVAGDFYWMESVGDTVYFAAADCTGHGVPGAMVSVVCSNALTKVLLEEKITTPGKILDRTRELVIEQFARSEEEVKDGMDISLVALTHVGKDGQLSLQWAGANNPLWIFRKEEIIEFKPDKQPIGKYADSKPFNTCSMELLKDDAIYIFTDGFQDQFGGEKGKKFKASNLKSFLQSIVHLPAAEQRELLVEEFNKWRGNLEQIDDVCIIGVRV